MWADKYGIMFNTRSIWYIPKCTIYVPKYISSAILGTYIDFLIFVNGVPWELFYEMNALKNCLVATLHCVIEQEQHLPIITYCLTAPNHRLKMLINHQRGYVTLIWGKLHIGMHELYVTEMCLVYYQFKLRVMYLRVLTSYRDNDMKSQ